MIRKQRRVHWITWILIALLLPATVMFAVMSRHLPAHSGIDTQIGEQAKGEVVHEVDSDVLKVNIRAVDGVASQLEVVLKKPLKAASTLIYDEKNQLLGSLGKRGVYRFSIERQPQVLKLKDGLKQGDLLQIEL